MRNGIAVGIGLFISFIGFQHGQFIVSKPGTMVGLNPDILSADIAVFVLGLIITCILRANKVKGDILIGIGCSALLALVLGKIHYNGFFGLPHISNAAAFQMDLKTAISVTCWPFIAVFLFRGIRLTPVATRCSILEL